MGMRNSPALLNRHFCHLLAPDKHNLTQFQLFNRTWWMDSIIKKSQIISLKMYLHRLRRCGCPCPWKFKSLRLNAEFSRFMESYLPLTTHHEHIGCISKLVWPLNAYYLSLTTWHRDTNQLSTKWNILIEWISSLSLVAGTCSL